MNLAQNWEAPFTGMSMGSVAGAFSGFAQVGTETTSVARWNSGTVANRALLQS